MSGRPEKSDAVAEVLRANPPALDDLQRARMERAILARQTAAPRAPSSRWVSSSRGRVIGGGLAAAAAIALFFVLRSPEPEAPVARFELRDVDATAQRGTLEAGSVLPTGPNEVAEIRIADSDVRVEPSSRLRIAAMAPERLVLELSDGEIRVGFHPRERGRERLVVTTPEARVEVIGTVFTVRARGGETSVSVSEGVVRVVPLREGQARRVRAGEATVVGGDDADDTTEDTAEARRPPVELAGAPSTQAAPSGGGAAESRPEPPSPRALLGEARRHLRAGRGDRAEPLLRRVADGSGSAVLRVEALALLGDLTQRSGRLEQAVTSFERAATLGHGTVAGANAIYALARLQERRMGDTVAARASYQRYLEVAADGALADQARAALCRLGDDERCP